MKRLVAGGREEGRGIVGSWDRGVVVSWGCGVVGSGCGLTGVMDVARALVHPRPLRCPVSSSWHRYQPHSWPYLGPHSSHGAVESFEQMTPCRGTDRKQDASPCRPLFRGMPRRGLQEIFFSEPFIQCLIHIRLR